MHTVERNYRGFRISGSRGIYSLLAAAFMLTLLASCALPATNSAAGPVCGHIRTTVYPTYKPLMAQSCIGSSLYVTASAAVPLEAGALQNVVEMADTMLANRPLIVQRLRDAGALLAVVAVGENNCDLPYYSDLKGLYDRNGNLQCEVAGLGGVPGRPVSACLDVNARTAPQYRDPHLRGWPHGQNVCVHEIAHLIMDVGLTAQERARIERRYQQVRDRPDAWVRSNGQETFALKDSQEFWAVMSQIYFHASPEVDTWLHNGISGADALRKHDRQTYNLVHGIYRGSADLR